MEKTIQAQIDELVKKRNELIVQLRKAGKTIRQIAPIVGVHRSTVAQVLKKYEV